MTTDTDGKPRKGRLVIAGFATWVRRKPWATLLAGALAVALTLVLVLIQSLAQAQSANSTSYVATAANASVQREVVGEATASVDGVPAQPVDSFVWDGEGSTPVTNARARLDIDPDSNTGTIRVTWKDRHGTWKLTQTAFSPPHHPTGLRLASAETTQLVEDDPVTTDVYLHGDTTAGGPVLPTVFNLLTTWGPGDVTLNAEPFENPFDGPAPPSGRCTRCSRRECGASTAPSAPQTVTSTIRPRPVSRVRSTWTTSSSMWSSTTPPDPRWWRATSRRPSTSSTT